jgi:thioredoxin-disulfide reductase
MKTNNIYDLIIIGAGPAGMSGAIYALRHNLKTLIVTKDIGGQMNRKVVHIYNYPGFIEISAKDLIDKFFSHLKSYNPEIVFDEVLNVTKEKDIFSVFTKSGKIFQSLTVVVASGVIQRSLNAKNEENLIGKGISYCPLCDGPLFKNKTVAIIGGGSSAFEEAIFMADYTDKLYILEYSDRIKAEEGLQEALFKKVKPTIILNAKVEEIKGKDFVEGLIYRDLKTNELKELKVDGIFIEIGNIPSTSFVKDLVDFNEKGEIVVTGFETMETKTPGLFAAGDCNVGKSKQIITACGEGVKAVLAAYEYVQRLKGIKKEKSTW